MKPAFDVTELHRPNKAAKVKYEVEHQTSRRSLQRGPGGRAREAVPKAGGEHYGEDGQQQDVAQLLRPRGDGPAEAGDERQNARVHENVQFEKNGKRLSARKACQQGMLL